MNSPLKITGNVILCVQKIYHNIKKMLNVFMEMLEKLEIYSTKTSNV